MEIVVNKLAKEILQERNLQDNYIKIYYSGLGCSPGLQMEFDEKVDGRYKVHEVDGYKIAINKNILEDYEYMEVKYSDNLIQKGFYPSIIRPEDSSL